MALTSNRTLIIHAIPLGLMAGLGFAAFQMLAAAWQMGSRGLFMPLRMIGAILLGRQALDPSYGVAYAVIVGLMVHVTLSIGFAVLFVVLFQPGRPLRSMRQLLLAGCLYGVLLWIVNFYVVAPILGWYWFPDRTSPAMQFLAHTFFYGYPLGYFFWREALMTRS
jgi:hypothetical protein